MKQFRTLRADEIDCRVSQVTNTGVILLLYKDARCDQNILDETVGPMNWQRHHTRDNANCIVSIWDDDKKMWIEKEDVGKESRTESEKGLASDSFKRACFNWGIGRELYTAPFIFIPAANCNIKEGKKCYDNFTVESIEYQPDGQREICNLIIRNEAKNNVCFKWHTGQRKAAPGNEPQEQPVATTPAKTMKDLMMTAKLAYGENAKAKFDELLKRAGCTLNTMTEEIYDTIKEWILEDIRKNAQKGAA